jgi:hypothetical protein
LNIIGGLLHTHLTGRKVRLLHYRNGIQLPNILSDEHFDFNYQDYKHVDKPTVILPGDEIVAECVYDTTSRNKTTFCGLPTYEEMCLTYIDYYPAIYKGFACLSMPNITSVYNALGVDPNIVPKNKSASKYLREKVTIDWTSEKINRLQDVERNGQHDVICMRLPLNANDTGNNVEIFLQNGYPKVTQPLEPKDDCKSTPTPAPATTSAASTLPPTPTTTHSSGISYKKTNILFYFISFITLLCYIRL